MNYLNQTLLPLIEGIKPKQSESYTLDALGLRKMNKSVVLDLNDAINGMVKKIDYLVKVEEVK